MLDKLLFQLRKYDMLHPGDKLLCAVSGGADSMALLWAMYLLRDKLKITVEAAHFNHGLRGEESNRDEAFVRDFCEGYGIVCHTGRATVKPGKKGLEAAARDARYGFLRSLDGKIATAHTADDNAETILLHLVRGTGLKGLGGITPVADRLIRPMLTVTRDDVIDFLQEYHIPYVEDSSNGTDAFLRNRLRHRIMPLLKQENPRLALNLSAMAMELREDEAFMCAHVPDVQSVESLREMPPSLRRRALAGVLQAAGVKEPERSHIQMAESLVFSEKPSAWADFPGNVRLSRCYDELLVFNPDEGIKPTRLAVGAAVELPGIGLRISACEGGCPNGGFTVIPEGRMVVRSRMSGDTMRLCGGTKSLKKLFIDKKIPAGCRNRVAVLADDRGILAVQGFGPNLDRVAENGICIQFEDIE